MAVLAGLSNANVYMFVIAASVVLHSVEKGIKGRRERQHNYCTIIVLLHDLIINRDFKLLSDLEWTLSYIKLYTTALMKEHGRTKFQQTF